MGIPTFKLTQIPQLAGVLMQLFCLKKYSNDDYDIVHLLFSSQTFKMEQGFACHHFITLLESPAFCNGMNYIASKFNF